MPNWLGEQVNGWVMGRGDVVRQFTGREGGREGERGGRGEREREREVRKGEEGEEKVMIKEMFT